MWESHNLDTRTGSEDHLIWIYKIVLIGSLEVSYSI